MRGTCAAEREGCVGSGLSLEVATAVATFDRVELALEATFAVNRTDVDEAEAFRSARRSFAVHILKRCSLRTIRRASAQLVRLAVGARAGLRREAFGWLAAAVPQLRPAIVVVLLRAMEAIALRRPEEDGLVGQLVGILVRLRGPSGLLTSKFAETRLVQIALRTASLAVLPVADVFGGMVHSTDMRRRRSAARSLAKIFSEARSAEVSREIAQRLAAFVWGVDAVSALAAARALFGAARLCSEADLRAQASEIFRVALLAALHGEVREYVGWARLELMRIEEVAMQTSYRLGPPRAALAA